MHLLRRAACNDGYRPPVIALGMTLALLTTAAAQPAADQAAETDDLMHRTRLTGDWGGTRTTLEDAGVRLDLFYNHTYGVNMRGGADTNNAQRNSGTLDLILSFDFGKMDLIPGGSLVLHTKSHFSRNINDKVAALSDPFDDADGDESLYFGRLFYEQRFLEDKIRLQLGYLDMQITVDNNAYAHSEDTQFMATFLDNNNAIVPRPVGLGASLIVEATDWLEFRFAGADKDGRLFEAGFDTAFHGDAGFYGHFETRFHVDLPTSRGPLPGNYRFGTFYDPHSKEKFETRGRNRRSPDYTTGDFGFYVSFDQLIYRESEADRQGLGLFLRYGFRHDDVNRLAEFWSGGAQYEGLIPGRDRDVLGLGMYTARASDDYRLLIDDDFVRETGYELYYRIFIAPWLYVTPDLQYIRNPGARPSARDAFVAGLRARVTF